MKAHPPRVPLVIRVGAMGLGLKELEALGLDRAALRSSIQGVLARIQRVGHDIHMENFAAFKPVGPTFRVISSLASGAPQIIAEEALGLAFEMETPLPLERSLLSFCDEDSRDRFYRLIGRARRVLELDDSSGTGDAPGEVVGQAVLGQSDILLAIWDGSNSKRAGDVGQHVREAMQRKIPVVRINSFPPHQVSLLLQLTDDGAEKSACNLDDLSRGQEPREKLPTKPEFDTRLREIFALDTQRLLAAGVNEGNKLRFLKRELKALEGFCVERQQRWQWVTVYSLFCRIIPWPHPKPSPKRGKARKGRQKNQKSLSARILGFLGRTIPDFETPFNWSDGLAGVYAERFRSTFVTNYTLGALAVLVAFWGSHSEDLPFWVIVFGSNWFFVELAMILGILLFVALSWLGCWHERWIDYRLLAESLRQMKVLAPFARVPPAFEIPAHLDDGHHGPTWFNWYFRALIRESGLIQARVNREYLRTCRELLSKEIDDQVQYHARNEKKLKTINLRLHFISLSVFAITIVACISHLGWLPNVEHVVGEGNLTLIAIVFPAFGAAIQGILHQGEFHRLSHRSHSIQLRLQSLLKQIEKQGKQMSFRDLGRAAEEFCLIQVSEQVDWRSVFLGKEPPVP